MIGIIVLVAALAAGTWFGAWWTVPIIAFAWGLLVARSRARAAGTAALAAVSAWALLLALDASGGRLGALGSLFGHIAGLPSGVFYALTLVFPALLAWSAAALGAALRGGPARRAYYVPPSRVLGER